MRRRRALARTLSTALCAAVALLGGGSGEARAATGSDPIWLFPVAVTFYDPCGVAVDSKGDFYVSVYYRWSVREYDETLNYYPLPGQRFTSAGKGLVAGFTTTEALDGPCDLALNAGNQLFVGNYHRNVFQYGTILAPGPGRAIAGPGADPTYTTGLSADPATGLVYVDHRTYVEVYDASTGEPVLDGGVPLTIGEGTLKDGYDVAVSTYPGTYGRVYVPDAWSDTIKVYDPTVSRTTPIGEIDAADAPGGEFTSLRDGSIAIDRVTGEIYVTDNTQPVYTELPETLIDVFRPDNSYEGHLKYFVFNSSPSGLAVDNSEQSTQGRVYSTSGNSIYSTIYAYPAGAATTDPPLSHGETVSIGSIGSGSGAVRVALTEADEECGSTCGVSCPPTCEASLPAGTTLALTAEAGPGSAFGGWSGACSGPDPRCTIEVNGATSVSAQFAEAAGQAAPASPALPSQPESQAPTAAPTTAGAGPAAHPPAKRRHRRARHHRHRRP